MNERLIFLDTNAVLDLAFEWRPRHHLIYEVFEKRNVGKAEPLLYTVWIMDEINHILTTALEEVRSLFLKGLEKEEGWDELDFQEREDRLNNWLRDLEDAPERPNYFQIVGYVVGQLKASLLALGRKDLIPYFEEQAVGLEWLFRQKLLPNEPMLAHHGSLEGQRLAMELFELLKDARWMKGPLFQLKRDDETVDAQNLAELLSFLEHSPMIGETPVRGIPKIEFWTSDRELEERYEHVKENAENLGLTKLVNRGSLSRFSVVFLHPSTQKSEL
ncbi:MAG: hypothetical protein ACP5RJ_08515 [Conexivisphaera sp.]